MKARFKCAAAGDCPALIQRLSSAAFSTIGVDSVAGEGQLLGPGGPGQPRQPGTAAEIGNDAEVDLRKRHHRVGREDAEVAGQRELESRA